MRGGASLATAQAQPQALAGAGGRGGRLVRWAGLQRSRLALWAPVGLGVGAAFYLMLKTEPGHAWGVAAGALALAAMLLAIAFPAARIGGIAIACIALGFAAAVLRAQIVAAPILREPTQTVLVTGRVMDAYGHQDGRPRIVLQPESIPGVDPDRTPHLVRIALRKTDARPEPGAWISVRTRLSPLPTPVAPGAYDFGRAAWFQGIGAYGFVLGAPRPVQRDEPAGLWEGFELWIGVLRHDLSARIRAALPGSSGAIAAALTVGDRSEIDAGDNDAFRDSSLQHVLSISGVHMVIVGVGLFAILRFLAALIPAVALRYHVKKWAAGAALIVTGFYLLLSGASVPAERSFIMIALMFLAVMLDRQPFSLRIVAVSAVVILLTAPESVFDPSFQMSFAAVTALISAMEAYDAWQVRRGAPLVMRDSFFGRALHTLLLAVLTSMVAGLATAPFAAYHFNRVAAYGVAANVLAMPLVSFVIMPFAALTLLAMPFGLEWYPAQVMGWGIDGMLWIAHETASWPGAASAVASWPDAALALVTFGGLWLAIFRGRGRLLGLAPMLAAAIVIAAATGPDILIDRNARNVAVRGDDGRLAVLSGRRAHFALEEWLERDGDSREVTASARQGREEIWTCADNLCSAVVKGRRIGFMERAGDARAACAQGYDLLIAARDIAPCASGLTITSKDTETKGAHAISVTEEGFDIETTRDSVGTRPWTVWPAQKPSLPQ